MKILFLVPYPTEGASNRVRVEQFLPYLESKGIRYKIRSFVNKRFYKILYLPSRYIEKIFWFIVCTINRIFDILRSLGYDLVFIHREAYPFFGAVIESILFVIGKPIIYDFDDAIFLPSTSKQNIYINKFKNPGKISDIIKMSRSVIAGNNYLRDFALQFNKNTVVIPSSVDTEKYKPVSPKADKGRLVIGWIGSNTTEAFLYDLEETFVSLSDKYKNLVIKIIGAEFRSLRLKNVMNKKWMLNEEVVDLQSVDIGIMPMPDNLWTRGKCGFKAILYMACGIPVVASPVGADLEIMDEGTNGFLACGNKEWMDKLSALIEDASLREKIGKNAREKIIKKYSLDYTAPIFYEVLINTYAKK